MFLIAGIQPKTHKGPKTDQICPRCGLAQVYERRLDHYASLFFIPLLRVKKGESFGWCDRCQAPLSPPEDSPAQDHCEGCGAPRSPDFRFCPHCGRPLA